MWESRSPPDIIYKAPSVFSKEKTWALFLCTKIFLPPISVIALCLTLKISDTSSRVQLEILIENEMEIVMAQTKSRREEIAFEPINEVYLVGRVSSLAIEKQLPSGDKVVEFRVVISRTNSNSKGGKKHPVDTLDIAAWSSKARRAALALKVDSWIEVNGAVRRRFWQAPTGLASRWQVEAEEIIRL